MLISIITVTFNSQDFLSTCVDSLFQQSYCNYEYIIIDGASTDNTIPIINSNLGRIDHFISDPDDGIYHAMNKGITIANGEIVGFLNSDDFYVNDDVLQSVIQCFLDDPTLDACYADLIYVDQFDSSRLVRYWHSNPFKPGVFSRGWCPPHPTFFVRRSVYERFGSFDLSYLIAADVELMMRFLEVHKIRVKHVPEVWVKMRMGGTTNKSLQNVWVQNQEILRALKSHGLPANPLRFFANKLWSRGKQFLQRPEE